MSTSVYDIGDRVRLRFVLTSTESTNPQTGTAASLVYTKPDGTDAVVTSLSTFAPSSATDSTSLGVVAWYYDVTLDQAGRWTYQFRSTGTVPASEGSAFAVRPRLAST